MTTGGILRELGRGVYAPREAADIVGITPPRVRRWVEGYTFLARDGSERHSPPLVPCQRRGDRLSVAFADLVELLFVHGFREAGVSWKKIRAVHTEARKEFETSHPFTLKRFEHDGRTIIERVRTTGGEHLVDRYTTQYLMTAVMHPLVRKLRYDELTNEARRYFPLGPDRAVVLDPRRSFGEGTTVRRGVPTRVLFGAVEAGESRAAVERWYRVDREEMDAAIDYERGLRERMAA
jgi:uncharacterized protein (DUF433 family)